MNTRIQPLTIDINGESGRATPLEKQPRINLSTLADLRLEMAKIYREARAGALDLQDATKLGYLLSEIGKLKRLELELETPTKTSTQTAPLFRSLYGKHNTEHEALD